MLKTDMTVSVVIPTYNRSDTLLAAIRSAVGQTHPPLEVIVVDDGSTDGTAEIDFAGFGRLVKYIRLPSNCGGAVAWNTGIALAHGEWIAFLDADDLWLPNKLEEQLCNVQSMEWPVEASSTNVIARRIGHADITVNARPPTEGEHLSLYLMVRDCALQTSSLLVKRAVMVDMKFDETLRRHQDWDLVLRVAASGRRWHYLDKPLSIYCIDEDPRRISNRVRDVGVTLEWLAKRRTIVRPEAAAYYFSYRCLPRALRQRGARGLLAFTKLSLRSPTSCVYAARGLLRLAMDASRRLSTKFLVSTSYR